MSANLKVLSAFFAGGVVTTLALSALRDYFTRKYASKSALKSKKVDPEAEYDDFGGNDVHSNKIPEELEKELFSRNISFFGEEGQQIIRKSFVIVVGVGGVGSHTAHMLARSGVGSMRIIDFDQVTLSSLNRHATAGWSDVGTPKAEAMARALQDLAPACRVEACARMFCARDAHLLLEGSPDYVVDAIDDVNTKLELLEYCCHHRLPVLSALAAGGKADPTRLHIGTLGDAVKDPLASKLRWRLNKMKINADEISAVYSSELPRCRLLPLSKEQEAEPHEFGVVDNFRVRVMPVLGTTPALMGQAMAAHVLCNLAGKPFEPLAAPRITSSVKHKMYQHLRNREQRVFGTKDLSCLDGDLVEHMVTQVWRSRCAVTGRRIGGTQLLALTRWEKEKGLLPNNLVLLSPKEADRLDAEGTGAFPPEVCQKIQARLHNMGDDW